MDLKIFLMIPHYLYQSISLIYKGGPPKAQNLFIKNCIFILTCSNFSHLQSTLLLRQYTYWDIFFKRDFIFTERGSEREREERNISVWLPLTCPLLGDLACNPGMCPDWESNQRPFGLQARSRSIHWATPDRAIEAFLPLLKTVFELVDFDAC